MTVKRYVEVAADPAGDGSRKLVRYIWARKMYGPDDEYCLVEVDRNSDHLYFGNVDTVVNAVCNIIKVRKDFDWIVQKNGKLRKKDFSLFWVRFEHE